MKPSDRPTIVAETSPDVREAAIAEIRKAHRLQLISYNLSIAIGTSSIGVGTFLIAGLGAALVAMGIVVIALTLYSAERFTARRRGNRVLDRTPTA